VKPYYEDSSVRIFHGDCREVLPSLPQCDLLLTDPPYGHGDKWAGGTWASNPIYEMAFDWDAATVSAETMRVVIASASTQIVWGGNYYSLPTSRCWLAWVKNPAMATMADFELAWTSMDRPSKLRRESRNPDGTREHPTQKPESIMRWCLSFAPDAKTVIDPFMGSGTTLAAAKRLGRKAIGIERHEPYCEIAARRLSQGALTEMFL
jgi:site-specific DNA-methyltransferase (adenine-specific)